MLRALCHALPLSVLWTLVLRGHAIIVSNNDIYTQLLEYPYPIFIGCRLAAMSQLTKSYRNYIHYYLKKLRFVININRYTNQMQKRCQITCSSLVSPVSWGYLTTWLAGWWRPLVFCEERVEAGWFQFSI